VINMRSTYAYFCLAALLIIFSASFALADLNVKGAVFEVDVSPGMQISHEIIFSLGDGDLPMDFQAEILGFGLRQDGTIFEVDPENDTGPFTARSFLHISPTNIHIGPGESQKITLTGRIPDNMSEGCRYALISVQSPPLVKKSIGIILAFNIPILLCVNSTDTIKRGKITDLKLTGTGYDALDVDFILRNTGNAHFKALVQVLLKDEAGIIRAKAEMPLTSSVLPQKSRLIKLSLRPRDPLLPGKYILECRALLKNGTLIDEMTGYYTLPKNSSTAPPRGDLI
jgi:hypothetical protein